MESWLKSQLRQGHSFSRAAAEDGEDLGALAPEAIPSRKKIDFQTSSDLSILGAASRGSNRLALPRDY